jgi:hypothetical protein
MQSTLPIYIYMCRAQYHILRAMSTHGHYLDEPLLGRYSLITRIQGIVYLMVHICIYIYIYYGGSPCSRHLLFIVSLCIPVTIHRCHSKPDHFVHAKYGHGSTHDYKVCDVENRFYVVIFFKK